MGSSFITFSRAFSALAVAFSLNVLAASSASAGAVTPPDQPALVDTSSSAGSVVASSSSSATYSADHAFDGNWGDNDGRWLAYTNPDNDYGSGVHGESPMYLVYKFNNPTKVNVLRLRTRNENEWDKRSPKAWTFLGSNDGTTWTQLDSRSGVAWASGEAVSGLITKTFSFENRKSYEYYKFCCTEIVGENNYMQIYELQFLYNPGIVLTDLTNPNGTVTTTTTGDWVKPAKNAFDNGTKHNNDDRSIHSGTTVDWIYTFDEPTKVNAYKVYAPGTGPYFYDKRMPQTWTFEAKNSADAAWTVLDTQVSETGWTALENRYYAFVNNTAYDSYRFAVTAVQSDSDSYVQIDELEFYYISSDAPMLGAVGLERTGAAAYNVFATMSVNSADLSWIADDGAAATTNLLASGVAEGASVTNSISGLAADTTYQISVLATNESGTAESVAGTLYTGELSLGATANANEYGLVAGGVVVSRGSADPWPLTVNYTISGNAGTEGSTWAAPEPVTIPAGAASATLPVVPLIDGGVSEDVTITVTLAAGNYEVPATASATLTLVNLAAPDEFNVWIAPSAGLASVGSNWSKSHSPTASEHVLFNGDFSTADCEWDADASATVASWTQTNGYTGTVTVDTVFPGKGEFTLLTVSGNMVVASGSVTHKSHTSANRVDTYRLRLDVGGDLTVASGAAIAARAKGSYGPRSDGAGSYGGRYDGGNAWGSLTEPTGVGSSANDYGSYTCIAGGAIWIEVTGATTLDGAINANGVQAKDAFGNTAAGSGGAVYLKTATLSGSGTVSANCENTTRGSNAFSAAGGRVSILLTADEFDSFPSANVTAFAGSASYAHVGGVGTVLVRSPLKTNGVLYLCDRTSKYNMYGYCPNPNQLACIPTNQTWTVDGIVFGANAILQVPTGTTLNLPGGLASVSSTGNTLDETGLLVDGGTLVLPEAETHTISGKWIFQPTDFSLDGNLVVTNGAGVGTLLLYSTKSNEVRTCGLSVSSNMYVASNSSLRAVRGGYIATGSATLGGDTPGCHGGQSAGDASNCAYDSFFHPRHPGAFGADNGRVNVGGGAIRLAVGGTLTLDGIATATPNVAENRSGAAGSIDITAARLAGAGRIEANGNSRNYQATDSSKAGGGGRIAVRLTGEGETFSSDWLAKINAKGFYSSKITADYSSSAGSVYLQTAAQAEGAGTIIIRNTGGADNNIAFTAIPSVKGGGENDRFTKATLALEEAARVRVFANLVANSLNMKAGTLLDLNGKKLVVGSAQLGGVLLEAGVYTQESEETEGFIADSVGGGVLFISGGGFQVHVR